MKVAYLVNQYPKVSHTFIRREIQALEARGVSVERYSVRPSPDRLVDPDDAAEERRTRTVLQLRPQEVIRQVLATLAKNPGRFARALRLATQLGWNSDRGLLRHAAYLAEACVILGWVRADQVEHLHAHFGTNSAAVAMLCHELGGPTYSFTAHGPEEFDKPAALGLGEKIRRAKLVFGVSSFGRSQLFRHCRFEDWQKIHVVRCGLDRAFIQREPTPVPAAPRLVCVGRLSEQKGQALLVRAAAQLRAEGRSFELWLVGDGELRASLTEMIREHGLEGTVHITGWASGEEVIAQVERARALVLPSFAEGLPVVIMEALALARPVVTTYVAGIPELVEPGRCGWLVPAGSVEHLVQALREVLDASPEQLRALGEEGRRRVLAQHDLGHIAEQLADLLGAAPASATSARRSPATNAEAG